MPLPPGLIDDDRAQRLVVDGRFVLWALHLPRPWITPRGDTWMRPGGHARTLDRFLRRFEDEELPVILAGDLNLTDRGRGYRRITDGRRDAMRGIVGSYTSVKRPFRPLLLRIDHILVPEDWCADGQRRYGIAGSDHRGVTARVGPCARSSS
jgi:endonuclease/exonuclease/phosphatase (EEP) superfamily protein YafD